MTSKTPLARTLQPEHHANGFQEYQLRKYINNNLRPWTFSAYNQILVIIKHIKETEVTHDIYSSNLFGEKDYKHGHLKTQSTRKFND